MAAEISVGSCELRKHLSVTGLKRSPLLDTYFRIDRRVTLQLSRDLFPRVQDTLERKTLMSGCTLQKPCLGHRRKACPVGEQVSIAHKPRRDS